MPPARNRAWRSARGGSPHRPTGCRPAARGTARGCSSRSPGHRPTSVRMPSFSGARASVVAAQAVERGAEVDLGLEKLGHQRGGCAGSRPAPVHSGRHACRGCRGWSASPPGRAGSGCSCSRARSQICDGPFGRDLARIRPPRSRSWRGLRRTPSRPPARAPQRRRQASTTNTEIPNRNRVLIFPTPCRSDSDLAPHRTESAVLRHYAPGTAERSGGGREHITVKPRFHASGRRMCTIMRRRAWKHWALGLRQPCGGRHRMGRTDPRRHRFPDAGHRDRAST